MDTPKPANTYDVARKFYDSLQRSQWLAWPKIKAYQETQLQQSLAHAWKHVPFYHAPLTRIRRGDGTFDLARWTELPVIDKSVVAADPDAFKANDLPAGHGALLNASTSGSEGLSFAISKTRFEHTGAACASFRYADWFGYDYATPLAMIRAGFIKTADTNNPEDKLWGPPWIDSRTRGARHRLNISAPIKEQLAWLMELGEVYLNTLPSNAMALAQWSEHLGTIPKIKAVLTVGEKLHQDIRDEIHRIWGCRISDVYSTAETGLIAIECPKTGHYHLQSEITRAEVLNAQHVPCQEGEIGHLVCTSIYNFAMPMIRYRFQDLVRVGPSCSCGRGLPVLSEILGRKPGLFQSGDGTLYAPDISTLRIQTLCGAREWQLQQVSAHSVVLTIKSETMPDSATQMALKAYVASRLNHPAEIALSTTNAFARTPGGKFACFRGIQSLTA
jgi:phenylacetate-CoA ligase